MLTISHHEKFEKQIQQKQELKFFFSDGDYRSFFIFEHQPD